MSLESDGTSSPSSTLRESFMHLLESRKDSIDVLGKELKIDTTQFKAVREVVSTYEERDGRELSQNKWGSIFKSLGCLEEFKTLLEEDLLLDVNSLDNCPPNNVSSQAKESLHKKSRESELPSKPGDDVKETWKTSTDPGDCPEKSFSSSLDKPRTDVVNDSTREVKDDEVEHLYPEVGKAAESMVSSNGQNLDPHVRDVGGESYSTTQISEDGIFRSDDLSSRSPPATPEANNLIAGVQGIAANHDVSVLPGNRGIPLNPQFSQVSNASRLSAVSAIQDPVSQHHQGIAWDTEDSFSSSHSDTDGSLSSDDSRTQSRPSTPQPATSPQCHRLYPSNLMAGEANAAVNCDGPDLLETGGMPLNAPLSLAVSASSLPTVSSRSAIQDPVGQYHQATATDTHGTDEAEENISSSQSDTDGSLSSDDSRTQSRPFTPQAATSPRLHRLHPSNLMAGEANAVVNYDSPALLETRGMLLNAPLSPAVSARSLPVVPSRSGTDEAEGGSLSSDDSRTQARPFTPQAANSPRLHRLHPSNLMAGEANAVVNYDRPALLETRGMLLNAPLSPAVSARRLPVVSSRSGTDEAEVGSLSSDDSRTQARPFTPQAANSPPVHARFAMQDPVGHVHWGMAREMSRDEEENSNQPSENDDETQDMNILQQVQPLQFKDIAFLIQELQEKSTKLEACKQEVQHCRQQCAQLQGINDEYERLLDGSNHLQQENQHLIRMTQEMCELKGQEIQQLRQLYEQKEQEVERLTVENESLRGKQIQMLRQMAQINDSSQQQIEQIRREGQERSEELRQTVQVVEQTQRELEAERESLRLENERMLDQRMTDEVKVLKRELDEQKRKGTEAEEHIKCLLEKNYQLYAMMEEMMSRPAEGADVCCSASSPDTLQENLVSSSNDSTVEEADEESDEDEEVFEDALDQLQLQGTNLAPSSTF